MTDNNAQNQIKIKDGHWGYTTLKLGNFKGVNTNIFFFFSGGPTEGSSFLEKYQVASVRRKNK